MGRTPSTISAEPRPDRMMSCPNCGHHLSMFAEAPPDRAEIRASRVIGLVANWRFPAVLLVGIVIWLVINVVFRPFEPHPMFMLSTFAATLATIAALQGPLILLTQQRAATRDRERDRETYMVAANTEADLHQVRDELRRLTEEVTRLSESIGRQ